MNDYKVVRLPLKGELVRQFFEIKRELGIDADTEVLRFLIRDYYKLISKRRGEPLLMTEPTPDVHLTSHEPYFKEKLKEIKTDKE